MYLNLVFDEVCEEMLAETDLQAARQHAYALQTMLANDLPYVTLYGSPMFEAFRSDRVSLPFTQTLDGLQHWSGLPAMVRFVPIQGVIPSTGGTLEGLGSSLAFPPGAFTPIAGWWSPAAMRRLPPSALLPSRAWT